MPVDEAYLNPPTPGPTLVPPLGMAPPQVIGAALTDSNDELVETSAPFASLSTHRSDRVEPARRVFTSVLERPWKPVKA